MPIEYTRNFYPKTLSFQCQLMMQLMRIRKIGNVMKKLGIFVKPTKKDEPLKHAMSNVARTIESIGKMSLCTKRMQHDEL